MIKRVISQEKIVQKQIINWLGYKDIYAIRINSGVIPIRGAGGAVRMFRGAPTGTPDIIGVRKKDGRMICVEVKGEGKKPSEAQLLMHETLRSYGAIVIVAYTLADVMKVIENE